MGPEWDLEVRIWPGKGQRGLGRGRGHSDFPLAGMGSKDWNLFCTFVPLWIQQLQLETHVETCSNGLSDLDGETAGSSEPAQCLVSGY